MKFCLWKLLHYW